MEQHRTNHPIGDLALPSELSAADVIAYWEGAEHEYIHLVRLMWDLHWAGMQVSLTMGAGAGPCLVVHRAGDPLRVRAHVVNARWFFSWGRTARVDALDAGAVNVICEAAR
ncbi:hypothetical protein [Nonomuraea sediminis]|uniref:hypothetical protein n=1 Tax=Nonomuraea sediminis TaxID=2835864 RepID=UPI001BDBE0A2|nr:hypothetical protein [Nonomuraea sediminis]